MKSPFPHAYTHNHEVQSDGSVAFECSQDRAIWPWLNLPPTHQIAVQTANFWASVESGMTLGTFDPNKWSALTQVDWECGPSDVGSAVRGTYSIASPGDTRRYRLEFLDADDQLVVKLSGEGVVFKTRDFEGWRGETKDRIVKPEHREGFEFVAPAAVGVETAAECFLGPLIGGTPMTVNGLITKTNGFIPGHPYIGGSGDHVNSTHMGEIGRQVAALIAGQEIRITSGEMEFIHYVELGRPFHIQVLEHDDQARRFALLVRQADRACTRVQMTYVPASS